MIFKSKNRQLIHYILIACTLLIQVTILVFFYNEYFNGKKLENIEQQLKESRDLKSLMNHSRQNLLDAQESLRKYINTNNKRNLESYFASLRTLNENIDKIDLFESKSGLFKQDSLSKDLENLKLLNLKKSIDSVYKVSQKPIQKATPPKIQKFKIEKKPEKFEIEVRHSTDTAAPKKSFFPRLKDAISGNVEVKRDTTYITTKYEKSVDTAKIKNNLDSTLNSVNKHYQNELKKYETQLSSTESKSNNLYYIYDNLLIFSNNLMNRYENSIGDYRTKLEKQYFEQNSRNNKIRKYSILGLMVFMFFVLLIIMYYTKLAFLYEKELKAANEKIKNNLNFKNRILGMLSHEIRSPLKIINIFINRINKKTDDENIKDYLKSMKFTNDSLLIQANQILEYTKNQQKQIELKPTEFNLKNEIDALLRIFEPYIESRNNSFEIHNEINPETIVFADSTKIHQIFINILGNANKFTENGKIGVLIKTFDKNENTIELQAAISDSGIGISQKDIKKIFEPYYQGLISDEIENLGAGLGLNLCKEIITLYKGNISVDSVVGKGSTVRFSINLNVVK